ncbi:hypothetical protein EPR50_G00245200 [Perca flavescens]|uniref:Uncharacterized protein n=1 Tax=Perca flavescens TaxID=8167 RepID=A0A484BXQ9_PERFV|nr:hypothetical protein EPR50_G00245200 [Perca flavescens]
MQKLSIDSFRFSFSLKFGSFKRLFTLWLCIEELHVYFRGTQSQRDKKKNLHDPVTVSVMPSCLTLGSNGK